MQYQKLLTIITEAALENLLVEDLQRLGAKGYTIVDARGKGSRGVRSGDWELGRNIQIEVICTAAVADAIIAHCVKTYYDNYAMILFVSDVGVVRSDKF
jgi:nitrogen regulatory protein PII